MKIVKVRCSSGARGDFIEETIIVKRDEVPVLNMMIKALTACLEDALPSDTSKELRELICGIPVDVIHDDAGYLINDVYSKRDYDRIEAKSILG